MSNPTSNFGWQMPTPTDLVTDLPADFEVFGQAVDTSMADLKGGTTGQILSKATNTDMDFVWITNDQGDITAVNVTSPITGGGTSGAVTVGIQSASTSQSGAVQLSDSTSTTSSVLASTPTATKAAYDLANTANTTANTANSTANAAIPKSTVTAKGSIVAATASSTPAQIAVGNNGESLVADSSTSTGLRYNVSANANLIAGGSFDIWQRGTGAFTTNNAYTSDRFYVFSSSSYSLSQETSVIPDGATYAAKITSTAGSSFANMQFALEQSEVEKLAGQTITFSVYLRANATYNGSTNVGIYHNATGNTQTGGTWTLISGAQVIITPSTSAYVRYTVTGTVPTTAKGLKFYIGQQAGLASGSILYIALAKAELGSVATPFVRCGGSLAGELAACQRYYIRYAVNGNPTAFARGLAISTSTMDFNIPLPVTLRSTLQTIDGSNLRVSVYGTNDYSSGTFTTAYAGPYGSPVVTYTHGSAVFTQNQAGTLNTTTGYLGLSAEL